MDRGVLKFCNEAQCCGIGCFRDWGNKEDPKEDLHEQP